jgi:hypothetical protein
MERPALHDSTNITNPTPFKPNFMLFENMKPEHWEARRTHSIPARAAMCFDPEGSAPHSNDKLAQPKLSARILTHPSDYCRITGDSEIDPLHCSRDILGGSLVLRVLWHCEPTGRAEKQRGSPLDRAAESKVFPIPSIHAKPAILVARATD